MPDLKDSVEGWKGCDPMRTQETLYLACEVTGSTIAMLTNGRFILDIKKKRRQVH